mmetsp:Transcript_36763/g.82379  ORF Transcript_36763/g.82379 Transcript_36763/m.82379 type:complete len:208 (+) Transcript_36763:848-1471(+)
MRTRNSGNLTVPSYWSSKTCTMYSTSSRAISRSSSSGPPVCTPPGLFTWEAKSMGRARSSGFIESRSRACFFSTSKRSKMVRYRFRWDPASIARSPDRSTSASSRFASTFWSALASSIAVATMPMKRVSSTRAPRMMKTMKYAMASQPRPLGWLQFTRSALTRPLSLNPKAGRPNSYAQRSHPRVLMYMRSVQSSKVDARNRDMSAN